MSHAWLGCIVEGQGEETALPILVRRMAALIDPGLSISVQPYRIKRNRVGSGFPDFETAIFRLRFLIQPPAAILALVDADEDDPSTLQADLLSRLGAILTSDNIAHSAVVACREYEAWFLAAATSLRGFRGLANDLQPPPAPDAVGGAKQWLRRHMTGSRKYQETVDQATFTARFDLEAARTNSPSFAVCYSEIERLLRYLLAAGKNGQP